MIVAIDNLERNWIMLLNKRVKKRLNAINFNIFLSSNVDLNFCSKSFTINKVVGKKHFSSIQVHHSKHRTGNWMNSMQSPLWADHINEKCLSKKVLQYMAATQTRTRGKIFAKRSCISRWHRWKVAANVNMCDLDQPWKQINRVGTFPQFTAFKPWQSECVAISTLFRWFLALNSNEVKF